MTLNKVYGVKNTRTGKVFADSLTRSKEQAGAWCARRPGWERNVVVSFLEMPDDAENTSRLPQ
jgi:hypothetical protein